jgi:ATP-binding cassette, subfamily B, bacterial
MTLKTTKSSTLKPLSKLIPFVLRYKGLVGLSFFFLTIAAFTTLAIPMAVRRMIDYGFNTSNTQFINSYFLMLCACAALLAIASACRYYCVITLGERVVTDIRCQVFSNLLTLSPSFFDQAQSGEIISRLAADTTQIKSTIGASLSIALRNIILGFGAVAMMVITSAQLATMVIAAIPLIIIPIIYFGRTVQKQTRHSQDMLANANGYAAQAIIGVRVVQAFTNEMRVRSHFNNAINSALLSAQASTKSRAMLTGCAIFIIFTSVVCVLWFGAHNVMNKTMSAGTLSQFLLYSVFAAGALGALSEVSGELSHASGATQRLMDLLSLKPDIASPLQPISLPNHNSTLTFENVGFSYPTRSDTNVIRNVSFSIASGETVAIVGGSGAGKSTIFALLMRFYDPQQGAIYYNDVNIKQSKIEQLRNMFALVPQDVLIFATSVAENIGFGKTSASRDEIQKAAENAYAHPFISQLENGYETQLGERGVVLSGGQRQRIAIARALLKDAPILLLDEATSSLDAESEAEVQAALDRLMVGRTTLIIAHRLATVLKADRILVLDKGAIVEEGTHQQLIAKNGIYARLAELQFGASIQQ